MAAFPEVFIFKAPAGFSATVASAARREHTTASEYLRRAALKAIRDDGLNLPTSEFEKKKVAR